GDPRLRIPASRRPISPDLRPPCPCPGHERPGRHPAVHAALHRRARDVRAPRSSALALDASSMARPGSSACRTGVMTMEVERLLVVSPNWLGDAVMALPAIGDLRRHFPRSRLLVGAPKSVAGLLAMTPVADEVVILEWPGRLWARAQRHADVAKLRSLRADVSVVLPNSFESAWLVKRAGIRERWGYAADLRDRLLSRAVPRPAIRVHQSEYYRRLMKGLNIENGSLSPELVVSTHSLSEARTLLASKGWDGSRPFVVMAPGAAYGGAKRW